MKPKTTASKNKQSVAEAMVGSFATGAVYFWASLLMLTTALFVFKIPITAFHLVGSGVATWIFLVWYSARTSNSYIPVILVSSGVLLLCFTLSILVSSRVIDTSYDGQAYHQEAVIQLSRGWNPVYMMLDGQATANLERWLNHYPKGIWYFSTAVYQATGNIEGGKFLALLAPIIAFAFSMWGMWKVKLNIFVKFFVGLALVFNPIVIYQSLSYYIDGILVSLLLSLAFVAFRIITTKEKYAFWPLLCLLIVLTNLKLSSPVFTSIAAVGFILYLWTRDQLRLALRMVKFTIVGLVLGVCVIGFNPYVTNFATQGHPLYPAMGKKAIDYLPTNSPENLWHVAPPVRLVVSIFSASSLARGEGQYAELKIPFTISEKELEAFYETNSKTGGFGPLFSGIITLTVLAGLCYLVFSKSPRERKYILIGATILIVGSASVVSMSSVARFVPYVWWVPAIVALVYFYERNRLSQFIGGIAVSLMLLNTGIVASAYYPYNLKHSHRTKDQLEELAKNQTAPITIDVGRFGSTKIKLQQFGIDYIEVPQNTKCISRTKLLTRNETEVCEL